MPKLKKPIVIKIGGSTLGSQDTTIEDLVTLQRRGISVVVVHGGGKTISEWQGQMGIAANFASGLRITDAKSLEVVTAVLAGLVNKELVATIQSFGGKAIGMSGVDGGLIEARVKAPELGYVGEVVKINGSLLQMILDKGYIPVIAPLGLSSDKRDGGKKILNINGDTVAGEIAVAIKAERLIFLTDVPGIYDSSGKLISRLTSTEAKELVESGIASEGMLVKVQACLKALTVVPLTRIIDGRVPHILLSEMKGKAGGTTIISG